MPVFNNALAGAAGSGGADAGYKIERSLRFNSSDDSRLDNSMPTSGNRSKFTFSFWVKFANSDYAILSCGTSSPGFFEFKFNSDSKLELHGENITTTQTVAQFRDPAAWYHVMLVIDKGNSTATERAIIYVNGNRQTLSTSSQGNTTGVYWGHQNQPHRIGGRTWGGGNEANYYLAEFHHLDGIAATPSDFGETDSNGVWQPIQYSGAYGTNGFYLDFSDKSSSAALGYDQRSGVTQNPTGTSYGSPTTGGTVANVFDGDTSTELDIRPDGSGVTLDTAVTATSSVRIYGSSERTSVARYQINGTNTSAVPETYPTRGWTTITGLTFPITINSFGIGGAQSNDGARLSAIEIDGTVHTGTANSWTVSNLTASVPTLTASTGAGALDESIFDGTNTKTYWRNPITITGITVPNGASFGYRGVVESGNSTPNHTITKNGTQIGSFTGTVGNNNWAASTNYTVNQGTISEAIGPSDTVTITTDIQAWHGADQITINGSPIVQASPANIDSLIDTPTDYEADSGDIGGNYCTWNPLDKNSSLELSNGNLEVSETSGLQMGVRATQWLTSGKWYWEVELQTSQSTVHGGGQISIGVVNENQPLDGQGGAGAPTGSVVMWPTGAVYKNGLSAGTNNAYNQPGTIVGVALDMDNKTVSWYINGSLQSVSITGLESRLTPFVHVYGPDNDVTLVANFGQRPFKYTNAGTDRPAATYLSICTQNLDASAYASIADGSTYFDTRLWTGNGTSKTIGEQVYSSGALTGSIDSGNPITRGFDGSTSTGTWAGSSAGFELTFPNPVTVASSITVIGGSSQSNYKVIVGGTEHTITFPNGSSSYTQEVTVNVSGSFTGIKATNNYGEFRGIKVDGDMLIDGAGEPLSFSPDLVWTKQRNGAGFHALFDTTRGVHDALRLHSTGSTYTDTGLLTSFNSDGFSFGSAGDINGANNTYIGFAWDAGTVGTNEVGDYWSPSTYQTKYIGFKFPNSSGGRAVFGLIAGTGTADIYTSSDNSSWTRVQSNVTLSTTDTTYDSTSQYLIVVNTTDDVWDNRHYAMATSGTDAHYSTSTYPGSGASFTWTGPGYTDWDFRSSGTVIKPNSLSSTVYNTSSNWSVSGSDMQNNWDASFDGDMSDFALPNTGYSASMTFPSAISYSTLELVVSRDIYAPDLLMNGTALNVPATDSNTIGGQYKIERLTFSNGTLTSIGHETRNTAGRGGSGFWQIIVDGEILVDSNQTPPTLPASASTVRANPTAGFSIVTYTGSGSATSIAHGLNAVPEMIILKGRDFTDDWRIYHKDLHSGEPEDYYLQFSTNARSGDQNASFMNDTKPTSTVFSLGTDSAINGSGNSMLAYCFTSIPGYSLLGSYTGKTSNVFVHCGFRPAFIMLKKTDGLDKWCMYDTARGTSNTLKTQLYPNEAEAETAEYFNFDILSNGFRPMDNSGQVNENGKHYVFYAVAEHPFKYARAR